MSRDLFLITFAALASANWSAELRAGEQIYLKRCASCHGKLGEGSKHYKKALIGDKSVPQLSALIAKTMPEDNPGTCSGPDSEKVAAYIYDAFYSRDAQDRNKPPRVELTRLTVKQYRNAVADIVNSFRPANIIADQPGLQAEYFAARNARGDKRQLSRIDPEVSFDFGTGTPSPGKYEAHEFAIVWNGGVRAPETGEYEFIVRTEHALKLFVNDRRQPLIDAWVKSGSDTEFRASAFLLAGREYPIRLEFSKAQQGVNEPNKAKQRAALPASIKLLWKTQGQVPVIIPSRHLVNGTVGEAFVPATKFPPDDRSLGWERGTAISKAWEQATTEGAFEAATYVAANLAILSGVKLDAPDRLTKLRDFARQFVERAFRRPLSEADRGIYVDRHFDEATEPDVAIKRVIVLALKSPRFLYLDAPNVRDGYAIANRLSFGLWDSVPDAELLKLAAAGSLTNRATIEKQAERMAKDRRAQTKLLDFLHTWLKADQAPDIAKDTKVFPGFDPAIVTDLRSSLDLFLEEIVRSPDADFRRLLLDDQLMLNARLTEFYGGALPPEEDFKKTKLDSGQRAGVLTHPYLMAAFSYAGSTSPIHRGVFVARGVLGIALRPPPESVAPITDELYPDLTTRERVILQTKPAACQSCHHVVNPLGFALEKFDAVGRFREKDNGKLIDSTGTYQTRTGQSIRFTGVRDLAEFLAKSEEVHASFAEQMFHHLVHQPVRAYGPNTLDELRQRFAAGNFNIRRLMIEVMVASVGAGLR